MIEELNWNIYKLKRLECDQNNLNDECFINFKLKRLSCNLDKSERLNHATWTTFIN